jgi:hypothetical protein
VIVGKASAEKGDIWSIHFSKEKDSTGAWVARQGIGCDILRSRRFGRHGQHGSMVETIFHSKAFFYWLLSSVYILYSVSQQKMNQEETIQ